MGDLKLISWDLKLISWHIQNLIEVEDDCQVVMMFDVKKHIESLEARNKALNQIALQMIDEDDWSDFHCRVALDL